VSLVSEPNSTSIHLKWDEVQNEGPGCIEVEGYIVRYNSTEESTTDVQIYGNKTVDYVIGNLTALTNYRIAVATFNFAGNSSFSFPIIVQTSHEEIQHGM